MEYLSSSLHIDIEQQCRAITHALQDKGKWDQLDDKQLAEFIVKLDPFDYLPTVREGFLIDALRQGPMTFAIVSWETRWKHHGKHASYTKTLRSLHPVLHIHPTAKIDRIVLRPETLEDKIRELFRRVEIDFPGDRAFSKTHYVLAKDHLQAEQLLTKNVRSALNDVPQVAMESIGTTTALTMLKSLTPEHVGPLIHAGNALADTA